jgi:nitrogen regulatory protein P-II 1
MYMILFVLHDTEKLPDILDSWDKAGVNGITIFPSTGLGRLKNGEFLRDDLPLIPSLEDLLHTSEISNRTLMTLVKGEAMVEKVVAATEAIIGDLDEPNTGILTVIPVAKVYGLNRKKLEDPGS